MYCAGDGNVCQRICGGIGNCKESCANSQFLNGLKNYQDMHLCRVRVKSEVHITSLVKSYPLKITIQRTHVSSNIISNNSVPKIQRLNLLQNVKDTVLISRRADH